MKTKLTENLPVKISAVFLVFFTSIGLLIGGVGAIYANELDVYSNGDIGYFESKACTDEMYSHALQVMQEYVGDSDGFIFYVNAGQSSYSASRTNFVFSIYDKDGSVVISNGETKDYSVKATYYFVVANKDIYRVLTPEAAKRYGDTAQLFTFEAMLPMQLKRADVFYSAYTLFSFMNSNKYTLIWLSGISAIVLMVAIVFLCCSAGHRAGIEGITFNPQDKIPYDVYLCGVGMILALIISLAIDYQYTGDINNIYTIVIYSLVFGISVVICLATLLTTATRMKAGKWWHNTLIYQCCLAVWKMMLKAFKAMQKLSMTAAIEWRTFAGASVLLVISSFLTSQSEWDAEMGFFAFVFDCAIVAGCCFFANKLRKVIEGGRRIAEGNIDYKIDTSKLRGDLKEHGENLNSIADGLSIAVEQRMKSERMKTELITNVSHDIKTPLTSIINYVDLLKKEPLDGQALEYANILEHHANRLKKLTEDLIEASKAATGNISAELVRTNLCELVNQAVGEYSERLEKIGVEPVTELPPEPVYILADGRLIWRVLDNLLGNAAKYSQIGTRLYLSLLKKNGKALLEIKNVSKERLNINADELTERFVRADSSRHTEGSGLGLNIAKSLTELQKGRLTIEIDGDLFKVMLVFDSLEEEKD
ncbi:MAG: HAMP domain-containing sensor histidine kinase [Clostridiaceae bacterium]|nr:HAMP domain-containing sensor histidine kinase [Clostridiaceae bacterium]